MSLLYTSSAPLLTAFLASKTPLTQLVYSSRDLPEKQKKAAYALLIGTLRYKAVLDEVLSKTAATLKFDKKTNRSLVLLMLYDLLSGESHSIQGGGSVKKILTSHSNLLRTTFVRIKIARGARNDEDLLPAEMKCADRMPRYARVNACRATMSEVHDRLAKEGYRLMEEKYHKHTWADGDEKYYYEDAHIPNLLVFSPGTDLHAHPLLTSGRIILQDKASCMPAAALDPAATPLDDSSQANAWPWHVLDACAAPGNKTSHLLAIALEHLRQRMNKDDAANINSAQNRSAADNTADPQSSSSPSQPQPHPHPRHTSKHRPHALEEVDENPSMRFSATPKPTGRHVTFELGGASATAASTSASASSIAAAAAPVPPQLILEAFEVDPTRFQLLHKMMARAMPTPYQASAPLPPGAFPSDVPVRCPPCPPAIVTLHNRSFLDVDPHDQRYASVRAILLDPTCSGSGMLHRIEQYYKHRVSDDGSPSKNTGEKSDLMENVDALAAFQKEIIQHAMRFPNVQIITYSTCSTHAAEDECVVSACLSSRVGESFTLAPALPSWPRRGEPFDSGLTQSQAHACVRVAGAEDGMNGFFVAKFVRKGANNGNDNGVTPATNAAPTQSSLHGSQTNGNGNNKRKRAASDTIDDENDDEGEGDDDRDESLPNESGETNAAQLSAPGKQSKRNKKKREKAKLKKQKLAAERATNAGSQLS